MEISQYLANAATSMNRAETRQAAGVAILKKTMDTQNSETAALIEMLGSTPSFGQGMDISV